MTTTANTKRALTTTAEASSTSTSTPEPVPPIVAALHGTSFQRFRSGDEVVQIPVRQHLNAEPFIVWSDVKDCFPGVVRVQCGDIYIPLRRDGSHYRIKPHGIHYYPDVVLDVILSNKKIKARSPVQQPQQHQHVEHRARALTEHDKSFLKNVDDLTADIRLRLSKASAAMAATTAIIEAAGLPGSSSNHTNGATPKPSLDGTDYQTYPSTDSAAHSVSTIESGDDIPKPVHQLAAPILDPQSTQVMSPVIKENDQIRSDSINIDSTVHSEDGTPATDSVPDMTVEPREQLERLENSTPAIDDAISDTSSTEEPEVVDEGTRSIIETQPDTFQSETEVIPATLDPAAILSEDPGSEHNSAVLSPIQNEASPSLNNTAEWSSVAMAFEQGLQPHRLTVAHVVAERMRTILLARINWISHRYPKFFVILPIKTSAAFQDFQINGDDADFAAMTFQDFKVYFLCDCGRVPGFEDTYFPHLEELEAPSYNFQKKSEVENSFYGTYMLGVLEMFKYGVVLDGVVHVPKLENQPEMLEMINCSINFLTFRGIQSSLHIYANLILMDQDTSAEGLKDVKPIELLTPSEMENFWRHCLVDARDPLGRLRPYQTSEGDTRRICWAHWDLMSPKGAIHLIQQFSTDPSSDRNYFEPNVGSFRGFLKNRDQMRLFFRVADALPMVPAIFAFFDWELTPADETAIQKFLSQTTVTGIKIYLQTSKQPLTQQKLTAPGVGHGHNEIVQAGLTNKSLHGFTLECRNPVSHGFMPDEIMTFLSDSKPTMGPTYSFAHMCRDPTSGKMDVALLCTDVDRAALWVRMILHGFGILSNLHLEIDSVWEQVDIKFSPTATSGAEEILDTTSKALEKQDKNATQELCTYFANRGYVDEIKLRTVYLQESVLLKSGCLHELMIGHSSSNSDVQKIRDMLKSNYKKLEKLELSIPSTEDPCQTFETFKSPLANCPNLKSFEIRQTHVEAGASTYCWNGLASGDRSQLTLNMTTYAGDRIGPLLQKMASCLTRLYINGIEPSESAILEKVLRQKKGPFKLKHLHLWDVTRMAEPALEDLKKIIIRIQGVTDLGVTFNTAAKASKQVIGRSVDFLLAIASKVTSVHMYGKGTKLILAELDKRLVAYHESLRGKVSIKDMVPIVPFPLVDEIWLSGDDTDDSGGGKLVFTETEPQWARALFRHTYGKLRRLDLAVVVIPDSVWPGLLQDSISFAVLRDVRLRLLNAMSPKTLDLIVDAIPEGMPDMTRLSLSLEEQDGLSPAHIMKCKARIEEKCRSSDTKTERGAFVFINRYL
ncbi:hypothetical protein BGZ74_005421 [Mortierella antarctica]|nr:hypothetical protein BGZ74_005421 [Mortierella antarctica]